MTNTIVNKIKYSQMVNMLCPMRVQRQSMGVGAVMKQLIILHVSDMARKGMKKIKIRTVDTDVVVIATAHFNEIPVLEELWAAFGRGNCYTSPPISQPPRTRPMQRYT